MTSAEYRATLQSKLDFFVHAVYDLSKNFPRDEVYGVTSQLRRAALSIVLNFIEGFARRKTKVTLQFFEIAYGSLQETKYLLRFAQRRAYFHEEAYPSIFAQSEEIGAMLWPMIVALEKKSVDA